MRFARFSRLGSSAKALSAMLRRSAVISIGFVGRGELGAVEGSLDDGSLNDGALELDAELPLPGSSRSVLEAEGSAFEREETLEEAIS